MVGISLSVSKIFFHFDGNSHLLRVPCSSSKPMLIKSTKLYTPSKYYVLDIGSIEKKYGDSLVYSFFFVILFTLALNTKFERLLCTFH